MMAHAACRHGRGRSTNDQAVFQAEDGAARRGRRISDGRNLPNIISDNDRSALRDYLCKLDFDFTVFCP